MCACDASYIRKFIFLNFNSNLILLFKDCFPIVIIIKYKCNVICLTNINIVKLIFWKVNCIMGKPRPPNIFKYLYRV